MQKRTCICILVRSWLYRKLQMEKVDEYFASCIGSQPMSPSLCGKGAFRGQGGCFTFLGDEGGYLTSCKIEVITYPTQTCQGSERRCGHSAHVV